MKHFDFLVIGGGIAGLTYAIEVAKHGTVGILFKKEPTDSSTSWAQGGVAAVIDPADSFELHTRDTLVAGADLCDRSIVDSVVREGPERIKDLVERGTIFDQDLHREGGHSLRRILHSGDATGAEILRALLARARTETNIQFFTNSCAIDLITTYKLGISLNYPNKVLGAYALLKSGEIVAIQAEKVMVATGGAGKVYLYTTNPDVATGDGIGMCFRAGVSVANLEFYQFHPTCLYHPKEKNFLITEAMRGEGAKLVRKDGTPFMQNYHELRELAPRDIVARAIDSEMKSSGDEFVLLDITHRGKDFLQQHFPTIFSKCVSLGLDISTDPIPVVPAVHYLCGGVQTNEFGGTTIENLYVAGETAFTGLHGANRLASNSLLEGLVFGHRAAEHSIKTYNKEKSIGTVIPPWDAGSAKDSDEYVVITQTWGEIRRLMWNYVGIVRSTKRLERALSRSNLIESEIIDYYWNFKLTTDLIELRNLSLVANLVIHSAMMRKESRGLHYIVDYPEKDNRYLKDTIISPENYYHYIRKISRGIPATTKLGVG
jgi:L-aspartate oxidase